MGTVPQTTHRGRKFLGISTAPLPPPAALIFYFCFFFLPSFFFRGFFVTGFHFCRVGEDGGTLPVEFSFFVWLLI